MLFLSLQFLVLFGVVFALNWSLCRTSAKAQNLLLALAGCAFYGWADLRSLGLILISAAANYLLGIAIADAPNDRRARLWFLFGVVVDLGLLGYFKYMGFFYQGFLDLLANLGMENERALLQIALPLGISFYTFQMVGYLLDVYHGDIQVCRKPLSFFTYVLHFPKLLAGPLERAQVFLPRIEAARSFNWQLASDGVKQFLWGAFAKAVVADNLRTLVDGIYAEQATQGPSTLLCGACLYLIQLYADFSGYSNMAIGSSKLLGVPLSVNFRSPLFVTNIGEFWRKWHVSLTSWFMDYLFTPLSFVWRGRGKWGLFMAIMTTFLAVGVWHGANFTFIVFGLLQGILFLPLVMKGHVNRSDGSSHASFGPTRIMKMILMFLTMSLCFVWMRAPDVSTAWSYWSGMFTFTPWEVPAIPMYNILIPLVFFLSIETIWRGDDHVIARLARVRHTGVRWTFYAVVLVQLALYTSTEEVAFIYFSF